MKIRLLAILLTGFFMFSGLARAQWFEQKNLTGLLDSYIKCVDSATTTNCKSQHDKIVNHVGGKSIEKGEFKNEVSKSLTTYFMVKIFSLTYKSGVELLETSSDNLEKLNAIIEYSYTDLTSQSVKEFSDAIQNEDDFSADIKNAFTCTVNTTAGVTTTTVATAYDVLIVFRALFGELYEGGGSSPDETEEGESQKTNVRKMIE